MTLKCWSHERQRNEDHVFNRELPSLKSLDLDV